MRLSPISWIIAIPSSLAFQSISLNDFSVCRMLQLAWCLAVGSMITSHPSYVNCIGYLWIQDFSFKVLLVIFKCLHNLAPSHLCETVMSYKPTQVLHSGPKYYLVVPYSRTREYGDHAFSAYGPTLWNTLLHERRAENDYEKFKKKLKPYFIFVSFSQSSLV